jgi:type I restriction enzyme S subunit
VIDSVIPTSEPRLENLRRLGDIIRVRTGKVDANARREGGQYPFFTCGEEILEIDNYAFDTEAVLLAGNGNFNVKWYRGKFNAYQRTYVIEPLGVHGKWLYYAIQNSLPTITKGNRGSTVRFIRLGDIVDCPIVVPPFDGQVAIVAEIEKQFTRLEAGVAGLRRVEANLKRYRAAVLKAASEGKLVPTEAELARQEGRTYETGAQLLERILTERRQKWNGKGKYKEPVSAETRDLSSIPEGWTWATLDQAFVVERGRFSIRPRNDPRYYDGPHPFVQIGDLPRDGGSISIYSQTLNDDGLKVSKKFPAGTILIAIVGATIANTGILTFDSCCPDSLVAIQSTSNVTVRLCEMYLRSIKIQLRNVSYASGGQPNINLSTLLPLTVPRRRCRPHFVLNRRDPTWISY